MLCLKQVQHLFFVGTGCRELAHTDQSADEQSDRVDRGHNLTAMRQSPLRADRADQPRDGRQSDQREPLERLIRLVWQQLAIGIGFVHSTPP